MKPPKKTTAPAPPLSLDERIAQAHARLGDYPFLGVNSMPVPAHGPLPAGTEVVCGRHGDAIVRATTAEGRLVLVEHGAIKARADQAPSNERQLDWYPVYQVTRKDAMQPTRFGDTRGHDLSYSQREFSGLVHAAVTAGMTDDQDYQRGLVWDLADKQKLIDSMFKRVDIGKFVVIEEDGNDASANYYTLLDGKQRLNAMQEFMSDGFEYQGHTWSMLSSEDRRFLSRYSVAYAQVSRAHLTREQEIDLFLRLNTSGRPQDESHLQKVEQLLVSAAPVPTPRAPRP